MKRRAASNGPFARRHRRPRCHLRRFVRRRGRLLCRRRLVSLLQAFRLRHRRRRHPRCRLRLRLRRRPCGRLTSIIQCHRERSLIPFHRPMSATANPRSRAAHAPANGYRTFPFSGRLSTTRGAERVPIAAERLDPEVQSPHKSRPERRLGARFQICSGKRRPCTTRF